MYELNEREAVARDAFDLANAKYRGGIIDFTTVLDSQRIYLQARRDRVESEGRLDTSFVAINKAIANIPVDSKIEIKR
jgi:outer membrane protein TolC